MKNPVAVIGALCAAFCLFFAPAEAIESARWALSLCAELLVPSLLPFFAASALLVRLGVPLQEVHQPLEACRILGTDIGSTALQVL